MVVGDGIAPCIVAVGLVEGKETDRIPIHVDIQQSRSRVAGTGSADRKRSTVVAAAEAGPVAVERKTFESNVSPIPPPIH